MLRIWAFEGWTGGEIFESWINRCASAFEKAHNGVFVQVKYVDEASIRHLGREGVRAPDMILFPPGLMDNPSGLINLGELPVRGALLGCGQGYAAPVALGGYGWAVNEEAEGVEVPDDESWRKWSRAASGGLPAVMEETEIIPPGIDLGLPAAAQAQSPMTKFTSGKLGAVCVTQREMARLSSLSDQGRGPEWTFRPAAQAWTDQVMYMSALAGGGERQELSLAFIRHLLTQECQAELKRVNAFTVLDGLTGYSSADPLGAMDHALLNDRLDVSPAFNINPELCAGSAR